MILDDSRLSADTQLGFYGGKKLLDERRKSCLCARPFVQSEATSVFARGDRYGLRSATDPQLSGSEEGC